MHKEQQRHLQTPHHVSIEAMGQWVKKTIHYHQFNSLY